MGYGIRIAKPGKDVSSEDPRDWLFDSEHAILHTEKEIFGETTGAESDPADVFHDLGFNPLALFYQYNDVLDEWHMPVGYSPGQPNLTNQRSDKYNFKLYVFTTAFKYFIFVFPEEMSIP